MTIGFITFFSIPGKPKKLMQEYTSARPKTNSVPKAHQAVWLWKNRPAFSPDPRVYIFTVAPILQPIPFYKVTQSVTKFGAQFYCKFELLICGNVLHDNMYNVHAASFYQLERQIFKIEASLGKAAVQNCLVETKGQLISKCLFGVIVSTKIATKIISALKIFMASMGLPGNFFWASWGLS